jgi:hypothetical protein
MQTRLQYIRLSQARSVHRSVSRRWSQNESVCDAGLRQSVLLCRLLAHRTERWLVDRVLDQCLLAWCRAERYEERAERCALAGKRPERLSLWPKLLE